MEGEIIFSVSSIFGVMTGEGLVCVEVGDANEGSIKIQMDTDKTREIALMLIEAATAADGDAALMHALSGMGMPQEGCARLLHAVREQRGKSA